MITQMIITANRKTIANDFAIHLTLLNTNINQRANRSNNNPNPLHPDTSKVIERIKALAIFDFGVMRLISFSALIKELRRCAESSKGVN